MRVGIIGGGQLARMMALSGIPMGIQFSFLIKPGESDVCVRGLGDCVVRDQDASCEGLYNALHKPDVITIDHENVCLDTLQGLAGFCRVSPGIEAVDILKNRLREKNMLLKLGISTAKSFSFFTYEELIANAHALNFPMVIKSCEGGYDGKQQYKITSPQDLEALTAHIVPGEFYSHGFIAEEFIIFQREISFIAARSLTGDIQFYAPSENTHRNAVLVTSVAPAKNTHQPLLDTAHRYLTALVQELNYVGVIAMECFQVKDGENDILMVNELAPRVHNSGHWTQAGCITDQFENHLRAILGLTLGSTETLFPTGMVNVLGKEKIDLNLLGETSSFHWYNKERRDNRKMGHINVLQPDGDYDQLQRRLETIQHSL